MNQVMTTKLELMGQRARAAARVLSSVGTRKKNDALGAIATAIEKNTREILADNAADVEKARADGLSDALLDRLMLDEVRVAALASDTRKIIDLPDPVGRDIESRILPNGLRLTKRRVPIGVLGVIYEARPNVTIDIATLCLKTGNAVILRGGSETIRSNVALTKVIREALKSTGLPVDTVQYIDDPDRALVTELLQLDEHVDMIVPRGGARLHQLCRKQSTIPVITGGMGICHIFIDESANLDRAVDIVENAKVQRPSVCNALDTLLVHRSVAGTVLPALASRLAESGVEIRAEAEAFALLKKLDRQVNVVEAGQDDFDREWLSLVLGVRIVGHLDDAIAHIQTHSTQHSDSILTNSLANAERFISEVNSAAVYVNASTRFTDGGEFGLGAEVAVSTQKLHARGPMGLEELTTYKWIVIGDGHIRE
jgi:glutamate-5-semialdehyde dehydrogenase